MTPLKFFPTRATQLLLAGLMVATLSAVALPAMADDAAMDDDIAMFDGFGSPGGHRGGMMGRGGAGGAGMHGHRMERMLDAVNASADQRSRIKAILQAARTDLMAQRQAGRTLHDQQRALFSQPNIDARAAETLRAQMSAQREAASKRMLQAKLEVANVLTPEQRRTLADRMAQRRAMMERHHQERQSLERR